MVRGEAATGTMASRGREKEVGKVLLGRAGDEYI